MSAFALPSDDVLQLSDRDRQLIELTQAGLPLVARPYVELARQTGMTPDEVMCRLQRMQDQGVIRRIAAVPNHYKLGFRANGMTVWDVADDQIANLGKQVGELDFVSHCYHRPRHLPLWPYNFFAMVHGVDRGDVQSHIDAIADLLGEHCRASDVLFSTRILKKTGLRIKSRD